MFTTDMACLNTQFSVLKRSPYPNGGRADSTYIMSTVGVNIFVVMNFSGVVLHNLNVVPSQFLCHAAAAASKKILLTVHCICCLVLAFYCNTLHNFTYTPTTRFEQHCTISFNCKIYKYAMYDIVYTQHYAVLRLLCRVIVLPCTILCQSSLLHTGQKQNDIILNRSRSLFSVYFQKWKIFHYDMITKWSGYRCTFPSSP